MPRWELVFIPHRANCLDLEAEAVNLSVKKSGMTAQWRRGFLFPFAIEIRRLECR